MRFTITHGPRDHQKQVFTVEPSRTTRLPRFLGTGKHRRSTPCNTPRKSSTRDLGISESESDSDSGREADTNIPFVTGAGDNMYGSYDPLPVDTMEGRVTGDSIEVKFRDILTLRNNDLKSDDHMTCGGHDIQLQREQMPVEQG